ncbi:MAG: YerC/YecD family TrpR-related protein [Gammaproteobacteria bacterium]
MKIRTTEDARARARAETDLGRALVQLRDPEEAVSFLRDLCTPAELEALADRWQVVRLLLDGLTYRDIQQRTGVSVTTVGRVARFLTDGHGGYRRVAERIQGDRT